MAASPSLSFFSRQSCAVLLDGLTRSLQTHGVRIEATPLHEDLQDLVWLREFPLEVFAAQGPHETHPDRTVSALLKALRYKQLLRALTVCDGVPGLAPLLRHLRRLSLGDTETQAWDHTFEIEAAAILHGAPWAVHLDETDIVLVDDVGLRIGCECKRPRSLDSVGRAIRDACTQLRRREKLGVVLVSLDQVVQGAVIERLHGPVTDACRARLAHVVALTSEQATQELQRLSQPHVEMGESILGVMFCATFLISGSASDVKANYFNTRFETHSLANPRSELCSVGMDTLRTIMAGGQDRLREIGTCTDAQQREGMPRPWSLL